LYDCRWLHHSILLPPEPAHQAVALRIAFGLRCDDGAYAQGPHHFAYANAGVIVGISQPSAHGWLDRQPLVSYQNLTRLHGRDGLGVFAEIRRRRNGFGSRYYADDFVV